MASPTIPQFQTLMPVADFRNLVHKHFEKEISEGQLYDARDLQNFDKDDEYALTFVQHGQFGASFDQERALRVFNGSLSWRKRHNVFDISSKEFPAEYFDRHAIFFKNHDRFDHPILHFVVRALDKGKDDKEAVKRFITYTFEQQHRQHPGQKIVILFDMSGAGISNMDYDLVKFIIASAQIFYPRLLAYMLIYKMPWLLSAAWRLIKTWMATEAEQFIKFVDEKSITEYVAPDQLSQAMGGTDSSN